MKKRFIVIGILLFLAVCAAQSLLALRQANKAAGK